MVGHIKKGWKGFGAALALTAMAVSLSGCGEKQSDAAEVLRVGSQRGGTRAMMLAAGELKDVPYKIEWAEFPSAQPQLEAISANAIDIGAMGGPSFLFAYKNDPRLRAVQALSGGVDQEVVGVVVHKAAPYRAMQDLRGRSIGTLRGSAGHSILLQALRQSGMKPADVKINFMAPNEALTAFVNGDLDALAIWVPFLATAVLKHDARVLTYAHSDTPSYMFQVSSETSIKDKRGLIEDFVRRYGRAQSWANRHSKEWGATFARETKLPLDIATYTAAHMQWTPIAIDSKVIADQQTASQDFGAGASFPDAVLARGFDSSLASDPAAKGKSE